MILALGTLGMIGISILRGYLLGPIDSQLLSAGETQQVQSCIQVYLSGAEDCHAQGLDIYWLTSGGKLEPVWTPQPNTYFGYRAATSPAWLPALSGVSSWVAASPQQATTVPAQSGSEKWRAMGFNVTVTNVQTGAQSTGTIIVATDVTTVYATIQKLIWVDTIVSAAIICVLAGVGYAVVRSNLRPLVEIEETAEEIADEIADGQLNRRVPERDPRTEIGSLGRSLNIMLSQIETAFHAREESEAAAHQSEERMRRFIADASHELRTPLTAIRGFAEYYRQRGGLVRSGTRSSRTRRERERRRAALRQPTWTGSCSGSRRKPPGWACSSRTCCCWPGSTSSGRWPGSRLTCSRWPPTRSHDARMLAPSQDHRPVGTARGGVPRHRRRAAAAAGHREPDEQRARPTPRTEPRSRCRSAPAPWIRG